MDSWMGSTNTVVRPERPSSVSYTHLEAYNNAYAQDYGKYQDYLSQLGTLHDYYSAQERCV